MEPHFSRLPDNFDAELFEQYLLGECPRESRDIVAGWLQQSDYLRTAEAGLREQLSGEAAASSNRVIFAINGRLDLSSDVTSIGGGLVKKGARNTAGFGNPQVKSWSRYAIAGALTSLIVLAVALQYPFGITSIKPAPEKIYSTKPGQRASIKLADGTQVTLAPATTMRVAGNAGRTIELNGEAVFAVVHSDNSPFTVHANGAVAKVLGTTFGVRAYTDDKSVRIAVADGKVMVSSSILVAGDAATVSGASVTVQHESNIAKTFAWTSGRLVFDRVKMREAIPDIERWYGIKILAEDALLERPIVTAFQTETASQAIHLLAITLGAKATTNGTHVTFTSN